MDVSLRAGLHFCEVADRFIFLDIDADRYFCLGSRAEAAMRALFDSPTADAGDEGVDVLIDAGLLRQGPGDTPRPCPLPHIPDVSALDVPARVPVVTSMRAIARLLGGKAALRTGGFGRAIKVYKDIKARSAINHSSDPPVVVEAAAFERTARWMRSHDQCLPRSLALGRGLLRLGYPVQLVIGVRMHPFAAHCWVQTPDLILNDRFEHVRTYRPILVI